MIASYYDPETGLFTGSTCSGSEAHVAANAPPGIEWIEGMHDHLSQRVVDGVVVDYVPPQPAATEFEDWEWSSEARRWVLMPTIAAQWRTVRAERDRLLAATDWVVTVEIERAAVEGRAVSIPTAWADYRQSLRDIPQEQYDPTAIVWPTKPA